MRSCDHGSVPAAEAFNKILLGLLFGAMVFAAVKATSDGVYVMAVAFEFLALVIVLAGYFTRKT
jgi:hypothetical protein